ncbi:hypothetical protein [Pyxidicoccus xibeiensis]|nr:hypothetical protein [Pyxidicoccus xibeiensis]
MHVLIQFPLPLRDDAEQSLPRADTLDRAWWKACREQLERRFR